jgi:amino acid adenylation domain-containing protein
LADVQVEAISNHFDCVVQQLLQNKSSIGQVSLTGPWDLQQALNWNLNTISKSSDDCVHDLISNQALRNPDHEAIYAWDGNLTYAQLETLSTQLALYLVHCGVIPGANVPICFEKSKWPIIAMLAVMKAGGVFIPLDPSHPLTRRQLLVKELEAGMVLVSPSTAPLCENLAARVVTISESLITELKQSASVGSPLSSLAPSVPANLAYILFTSGSTGVPKGVMVDHGAISSNLLAHGRVFGFCETFRVLQFSSYVFDAAITEILATLVCGGTICIPSDTQRLQNIAQYINSARVNFALLTPSFTRTFEPSDVPQLKMLVFGGEAPIRADLEKWYNHVELYNAYGPTETCIMSTIYKYPAQNCSSTVIGQGFNQICWVVDPNDHHELAPIGCVGELVVQGRPLAQGYFKDKERSDKSFVNELGWLPAFQSTVPRRFYKTGDLVRYTADGMIDYIGRKDTQVKLRGQRLELQEVEHTIKAALSGVEHVLVSIVGQDSHAALAAFFSFAHKYDKDEQVGNNLSETLLPMDEKMTKTLLQLASDLQAALPAYMVPTYFLPLQHMPFVSSMKMDRKALHDLVNGLSTSQYAAYSLHGKDTVAPTSPMELRLRELWAEVLQINPDEIGKNDDFLQVGGDSISAIQLTSLARRHGLGLTVASIFKDARLSCMASSVILLDDKNPLGETPITFSLLPDCDDDLLSLAREQCGLVSNESIEDAYPCTPLQEGLMALAVKQPGSYVAKHLYKIPEHVEIPRFIQAWDRTVSACTSIRTRIVFINGKSMQVLVKRPNQLATDFALDTAVEAVHNASTGYGSPLCHYALARGPEGQYHFALSIHHSISDGWTMGLVWQQLSSFYYETEAPKLQPYSRFIKYLTESDHKISEKYWKAQLKNAKPAVYPLPTKRDLSSGSIGISRSSTTVIPFPSYTASSITKATILRAAWAIILGRYCDSEDICFGTSVSGRHAPVMGLDNMTGPLVTTIPIRMNLDRQKSIGDFLADVQTQASDMVPHEQFGLQNIMKLSSHAHDACEFSNLLVVQPARLITAADGDESLMIAATHSETVSDEMNEAYFNYPLVIQVQVHDDHVDFNATYDSRVLTDIEIETLSNHFDYTIQQLCTQQEMSLGEVALNGPRDLEQAIQLSGEAPEIVDACIHELIERQAQLQPHALAVESWDGTLTYGELDNKANRLASHLIRDYGVLEEDMIHVCFEKSVWFIVAILAINKAGGVWVPLDPSHPTQRHQQVGKQTRAKLALASTSNANICRTLDLVTVEVTAALDDLLAKELENTPLPSVVSDISPRNAAYVLFTSGSTGTPKGLIMEHRSVCTSQTSISKRLRFTPEVRMLQFASYVFDLCIGEIFCTLISGGCLCIPSDEARLNGLVDFINTKRINWAFLTPAFVRILKPAQVPDLKNLLLAGEAVGQDIVEEWLGKVRLINGWGPAETCVFSTLHEWKSTSESPLTIGQPVGSLCWIVDPEDPMKLAPIGCIGEVIIQGPTLLREYLSDSKKTDEVLITDLPSWIPEQTNTWSQFYKSGDLAFYNSNRMIEFVGRKDTQVKVRGLRIELGEVEYHIRSALDGFCQVAVDVLKTDGGVNLISYLCFSHKMDSMSREADDSMEDMFLPVTSEFQSLIVSLTSDLTVKLPRYMIPTTFIPCRYMPTITSTKLDRNKLRRITAGLSVDDLSKYSHTNTEKRPPKTSMEKEMQRLWAAVLHIPPETIGRDDSFLHLGGDSISAVELVLMARKHGINIWAASIFEDARLSHVSAAASFDDISSDDEQ